MPDVKWNKEVALEIIKTGFIRLTKKYHPDLGGSHLEMLVLNATKEHLEKSLSGAGVHYSDSFRYSSPFSREEQARQAARARAAEEDRRRRKKERDDFFRNRGSSRSQFWSKVGGEPSGDVPIQPYPHDPNYWMLSDVTVMSKSEKAIKIKIPQVSMPAWLPFSQMHQDSEIGVTSADGDTGQIVFTAWIARQKGWLK
jgi:hypothetical protein